MVSSTIEGYNDANWISDSYETKSTSGYVFILGGALKMTGSEAKWLKNFLANIPLQIKPTPSVSIYCDNQSTIAIAKNKTYNRRNKHIQLRHNSLVVTLMSILTTMKFDGSYTMHEHAIEMTNTIRFKTMEMTVNENSLEFFTIQTISQNGKFVFLSNRVKALVEAVRTYHLTLDIGYHLNILETLYKSQAMNVLEIYLNEVERPLHRMVKVVKSNRGDEYYKRHDEIGQHSSPFSKILQKHDVCLKNCHALACLGLPSKNPQEKKLDARITNGYFISYPRKSKGYIFYYPNHSMRIVEIVKARFNKNDEINGGTTPQDMEIKEVRKQVLDMGEANYVIGIEIF
ncbi:hypothetical protein CR513_37644, partial [Mucuna pruriens]